MEIDCSVVVLIKIMPDDGLLVCNHRAHRETERTFSLSSLTLSV